MFTYSCHPLCVVVPSPVEEMDIQIITGASVKLRWSKPKDNGGFNGLLTYTVVCYLCTCINVTKCDNIVQNAIFSPAATNLNTTYVSVSNLMLNRMYKFKVISVNSLRNVPSARWKFKEKCAGLYWAM